MSVEQTTQLIQLVLNSVLMVTACGLVLGGLLVRYSAIESRIQSANTEYLSIVDRQGLRGDRPFQMKKQLRQLQQQSKTARLGLLALHYALLVFVASTFALALRTLVNLPWLISTSLILFSAGTGVLLLGVLLVLVNLHQADRPLWEDMKWLLNLGRSGAAEGKADGKSGRSRVQPPAASPTAPKALPRPRTKREALG